MSAATAKLQDSQHTEIKGISEKQRLGVWFLVLCLLVSLLVFVGGMVRLSDSGLSIPEWPLIQGSLLPPLQQQGWVEVYKTYYLQIHGLEVSGPGDASVEGLISLGNFQTMFAIEYFHRLMAALVSILFLVLFVQVMRLPTLRRKFHKRLWGMLVLLLSQAILGGIVVKLDLKTEFVAVHLGLAFLFFALVLWTTLDLLAADSKRAPLGLRRLTKAALFIVYVQIISGGTVAASHAGHIFNTWPKMGQTWLPSVSLLWSEQLTPQWLNLIQNQVLIQFFHRYWAYVAAVTIILLIAAGMRQALQPRVRSALRALASVLVLQILLGISTLVAKVPISLAIAHLMVGLMLFAVLVFLTHQLCRDTDETA